MDPISQGVVGAAAAQSFTKARYLPLAGVCGALAGMAADLDILIRSTSDPLMALEYHRHFTHSLVFIPIGGLLCALFCYFSFAARRGHSFLAVMLWATAGFATHGLLDSCTSYGTQLLWPFADTRFSIDVVSVVDPLFTLPAMFLLVLASLRKSKLWVYWALAWGAAYLGLGVIQHQRAMDVGYKVAAGRGHKPVRLEVKPSFANLVVWKVIYQAQGRYYVLAVKPGVAEEAVWAGSSIAQLNVARDFPWLDPHSQQAKDIQRFEWFSQGFLAVDKHNPNLIVDMRYSLVPDQIQGLWGIQLSPSAGPTKHVEYIASRDGADRALGALWAMIWH